MNKEWQLANPLPPKAREQYPELPEVVLQLLFNRGLQTQKKIDEFLNPDYSEDIYDPFLFRDMKKAVERINLAIERDELIVVHGDYDADGVCGAAILTSTLKTLGAKHLDVFLPDRELEGYGVNKNTVEIIAAANGKLLITCDCGVSNKAEIERANELRMDVIITDHHTVPKELPPAFAIIHPLAPGETYPDKNLSGGGVAFKLAQALLENRELGNRNGRSFGKWLLDLVAISTVADMMPLLGESRTLVKYGLIVLNKTKRLGLRHLIEIARLNKRNGNEQTLDTHNIGFQIAPRLNAAGRMKHANTAYQLLITTDNDEAKELARELDHNNQERQKETAEMLERALTIIKKEKQEDSPAIFALQENWPIGLIGLAAARLCEQFYRPAIVMTLKDGKIHGSGRSIDEIDIISKIAALKDFFEKFGGHPQACGFTLKDGALENFKKEFNKLVGEEIQNKKITPVLAIDAELKLADIGWSLYDLLQKFEPFGEANPEPTYLLKNLDVVNVLPVGADGQHLKLAVKQDGSAVYKIIGFCFGDEKKVGTNWCAILKPGDKIDAVVQISVNVWNGNRELQLKLIDIKHHTDDADYYADDANHADDEDADTNLVYGDLTYKLNGILFNVHNKLGKFCNEKQICDAIEEQLKQLNIPYKRELILPESFVGERFGRNRVDFLIDDKIILEVKVKNFVGKEEYYQCLRYLEALDKKLCLLINFRVKHLKIKRILNPKAKI